MRAGWSFSQLVVLYEFEHSMKESLFMGFNSNIMIQSRFDFSSVLLRQGSRLAVFYKCIGQIFPIHSRVSNGNHKICGHLSPQLSPIASFSCSNCKVSHVCTTWFFITACVVQHQCSLSFVKTPPVVRFPFKQDVWLLIESGGESQSCCVFSVTQSQYDCFQNRGAWAPISPAILHEALRKWISEGFRRPCSCESEILNYNASCKWHELTHIYSYIDYIVSGV